MGTRRAALRAIRSYLPERKLTNEQLAREFQDWDVAKIYDKTGIAVRGIAGPGECSSDLGAAAAQRLFDSGVCRPADVDFMIFCTQSPDHFLPATACLVQDRLGLPSSCGALDINQGCSGFIYGLALAKGLIESGTAERVLLITADTYTKYVHPLDRSVRTLFGDGAAATLVTAWESEQDLLGPFVLGTDGRGAPNLIVPAGGLRKPLGHDTLAEETDASGNRRSAQNLYMNGAEIFNFSLQTVPQAVNQLLTKSGRTLEQIDLFVMHQANKFMLENLRRKLRISPDRFVINMESYGNTVSSTIPMALEIALARGQLAADQVAMLVGFGVGYSWGATLYTHVG